MFNKSRAEFLIKQELEIYPKATLKDIYKLFYQSTFGSAHAIKSITSAQEYLRKELDSIKVNKYPLEQDISYILQAKRVNIYNITLGNISEKDLLSGFYELSHIIPKIDNTEWIIEWNSIKNLALAIDNQMIDDIDCSIDSSIQFHHSDIYRTLYAPHYRICSL